jgi:phenylpyruvate tautomerase PptA (4-oxalocrotonate tautomerase family)
MPQIELTVPRGALPDDALDSVMADATTTLLRWEGAPVDSPGAREVSWGYVHEVDRTYHAGSPSSEARYRFDITVPAGALNEEKKNGLVADLTRLVLSAEGVDFDADPAAGMRVWALVHEVPDGNWGGAGRTWKLREIAALVNSGAAVPETVA